MPLANKWRSFSSSNLALIKIYLYSDGSVESCGANPNNPWNPFGSGILLEDWSFPIFLIDNPKSVQELILECYERNKPLLDEPRYIF